MFTLKFKEYLEQNTVGYHNDRATTIRLPSDWSGTEAPPKFDGRPPFLASLDVLLPSVTVTSEIRKIEKNKNPITISLADGTKLFLTWGEYKRISGPEPAPGKRLTVTFQRNPGDKSNNLSQVNSILCH
ncbi:MAG: hypothetical protein DWQ19_10585 [Crenarchaeota archaeon]|nr:MAG: hypothetical protein DWQ19_10585 [Thermoproteota archaeon]